MILFFQEDTLVQRLFLGSMLDAPAAAEDDSLDFFQQFNRAEF
jgi:hypothetical protein